MEKYRDCFQIHPGFSAVAVRGGQGGGGAADRLYKRGLAIRGRLNGTTRAMFRLGFRGRTYRGQGRLAHRRQLHRPGGKGHSPLGKLTPFIGNNTKHRREIGTSEGESALWIDWVKESMQGLISNKLRNKKVAKTPGRN